MASLLKGLNSSVPDNDANTTWKMQERDIENPENPSIKKLNKK